MKRGESSQLKQRLILQNQTGIRHKTPVMKHRNNSVSNSAALL